MRLLGWAGSRLARFGRGQALGPGSGMEACLPAALLQHTQHSFIKVAVREIYQRGEIMDYHMSDAVVAPDCSITSGATTDMLINVVFWGYKEKHTPVRAADNGVVIHARSTGDTKVC